MFSRIKDFVKSSYYTKKIYSKLQALFIECQYKIILYTYKNKKVSTDNKTFELKNKPAIFYLGTDELQDKSGFLQALGRYSNLQYFTKEDGSYGTYNYGVLNRSKNINSNRDRLLKLLSDMVSPPDILLMQTWEWRIGLSTLIELKKRYPKMLLVNIGMDDRHSFWLYGFKKFGSAGLIPALDMVFTTSSEAVSWYRKEGCNAYFFPLASDSNIFKPTNDHRKYDVGFVGAKYGIREEIVNALNNAGVKVKAYGSGWADGRLPIDDTNKFYNQCEIVLGVGTILGSSDFTSMKLRDFDVPMSGSIYLTSYNEDTSKIFQENKEIFFYKNLNDCIDKAKNLLSDKENLINLRSLALNKALENTYDQRIDEMLNNIRGNR